MSGGADPELAKFVATWEEALLARQRPEVVAACFKAEAAALVAGRSGDALMEAAAEVDRLRRGLCLE